MIGANEALRLLRQGNSRFAEGRSLTSAINLRAHVNAQKPFAVILGCSDSRVPLEIIFDQSVGDLFVIRVAGNIAGSSQVGSVEFAVANFDCPLVVVIGHENCGAVTAAVAPKAGAVTSPALMEIIASIQGGIETPSGQTDSDIQNAIRQNIFHSVEQLRRSELLKQLVDLGRLTIVGAEYYLDSGQVEFFD